MMLVSEFSLSSQNPWWLNPAEIKNDIHITASESSKLTWDPRIIHTYNLSKDAVYTLRGPRQVGKTTAVKLMIKKLLENGVPPRQIFYWVCDLIESPKSLVKLLEDYITTTRNITDERLYIFLDEISAVKEWQRGIKYLYDTGKLVNTTILMTGSHSIDIRRAVERLPGRRGQDEEEVMDKILLPMKFSEYVELRDPLLRQIIIDLRLYRREIRDRVIGELASGQIPHEIQELSLYLDKIESLFNEYLITGGLISSINHYVTGYAIPDFLYQRYVEVTLGDIRQWNRNESYLIALLKRVEEVLATPISWNSLKKGTDISHTNTVADYIDVLESSFILSTLYKLDTAKSEPIFDEEKKIYFRDPFIFHSLRAWVRQQPPFKTSLSYLAGVGKSLLVESVVADHLIRLAFIMKQGTVFEPRLNVFYWKTKKHEVDFVVKLRASYLPIDIKYQNTISPSDFNGLHSFPNSGEHGILATKNQLTVHRGTVAVPISLLLTTI